MRDLVLIDGAGASSGFDAAGGTIADAAAGLRAAVLAVVRAGLGTLNQAALRARRCARVAARAAGSSSGPGPRRQTSPPAATSRNCARARRCWGGCPAAAVAWTPRRSSRWPEPGSHPLSAAPVPSSTDHDRRFTHDASRHP